MPTIVDGDGPDEVLPTAALPPVSPLRHLALAGLVLVVCGGLALGWLYRTQMLDEIMTGARQHAIDLASSLGAHLGPTVESALQNGKGPLPPAIETAVAREIRTVGAVLPILQANLIALDGRVVFSTDASQVGALEARNPRFRSAASGAVSCEVSTRRDFVMFDRRTTSEHALATSVPLRDGTQMIGVIEIFQDVQAPIDRVEQRVRHLLAAVIGVMIVLYIGLLALGRHIERLVQRQNRRIGEEIAERRDAEVHLRRVQDDMERTIAERTQRLRENEARFREFAESASDWLWEMDADFRFTYISEGLNRILNLDPADFIGRTRDEINGAPGDAPARWQAHRDDLLHHRPFRDFVYTLHIPGKGMRTVAISGKPVFDDTGRFRGYRGIGSDATERHKAEQTITRLGRILDQSANEVFIIDATSLQFVQVNRGARRNLGYATEEITALGPLDIVPSATRDWLLRRLEPLRRRPSETAVFETFLQRKDGSRYPVEFRLQYAAQERPPVYVGVAQDITARKRTEQALQESEDRYRTMAEMSLDAILVHVDDVIVYANRQAGTVVGGSTDVLIGRAITEFITPEYQSLARRRLDALQNDGAPSESTEMRLLRADGSVFDAEVASSSIAFGGRPAVQTVLRDITERKAVQGQLIQTAKLATLGEMAAGMAHELSQPMNVIRMAAEGALLDGPAEPSPTEQARRATLEIIVGQAARMGEIIDHMRIFSRKQAEDVEMFEPALCIKAVLNMVEAQFYAEDISLAVRYPSGTPRLLGRPVHLEQVLLNLLTNARDAVRQRAARETDDAWRASIAIDAWVVPAGEAGNTSADDMLHVTVADNGGGIPEDSLDRIFEPFFTTKEVGTGTGLGLSVSFGLIGAMGGTITARNENGGALFEIEVPVSDAPAPAQPEAAPPQCLPPSAPAPAAASGDDDEPDALLIHVLVVDDEPFATKLVSDHLSYLGYRVTTAADGEEGYERFLTDPPDIVVTDLRMPRCDGMELMRRMHEHVPDLPVIVATGHLGHLETASAEMQDHAAAILKKPISLKHLSDRIRSLVALPETVRRRAPRP